MICFDLSLFFVVESIFCAIPVQTVNDKLSLVSDAVYVLLWSFTGIENETGL